MSDADKPGTSYENDDNNSSDESDSLDSDVESDTQIKDDDTIEIDETETVKKESLVQRIITKKALAVWRHFHDLVDLLYQDISALFSEGEPFFIDVDACIFMLMKNEQYCRTLGGSTLHLTYMMEDLLNIFVERGGNFQLVFFEAWRKYWKFLPLSRLQRHLLIEHFRRNTNYTVHVVKEVVGDNYRDLISKNRPQFLLTNFNLLDNCPKDVEIATNEVICWNILYNLSIGLPCVDCNYIDTDLFNLKAFYCDVSINIIRLVNNFKDQIKEILNVRLSDVEVIKNNYLERTNVRILITILAAKNYAKNFFSDEESKEMLKIFILHTAVLDTLKLENRSTPVLKENVKVLKDPHLYQWFMCLYKALISIKDTDCDWSFISDIWQGLLYGHLCRFLSECTVTSGAELGDAISSRYEDIINNVKQPDVEFEAYPITMSFLNLSWEEDYKKNETILGETTFTHINNVVFQQFCQTIVDKIRWKAPPENLFNHREYSEEHHYHSMKVITDEHDRIKNTITSVPTDPRLRRRFFKERAGHAKYMTVYGSSIEGNVLTCESVVRQNQKENKKEKKTKLSKKAIDIIEKNKNKKLSDQAVKERVFLTDFEAEYKKSSKISQSHLSTINIILNKVKTPPILLEVLLWKIKLLLNVYRDRLKKNDVGDLKKDLFLCAREIINLKNNEKLSLKSPQSELLAEVLSTIDCLEIAKRNKLTNNKVDMVDGGWIEYQLKYLGPELERVSDGTPDLRVKGFIPDNWQRELFNVVDKRQSAVIIAPTSSGKTYASYYCMESVLKEGTDGVVVYVSPTKALVNQVAATVYARFKNTVMPPGQSVYGVFTRDFRTYATNCQILVTVPQCLELLLMSPRRYDWVKRLRYVIFDEVHCIAGNIGGVFWERCLLLIRCPFLALSATIRYPQQLHNWLQNTENFKQKQDISIGDFRNPESYRVRLVVHSERHSDLIKYVFENDNLNHIHPYANLEEKVVRAHNGIPNHMFLSPAETLQLYEAMKQTAPLNKQLQQLSPVVYFSQKSDNGFITRNLVREYEKELSNLLTDWYKNEDERKLFCDTIRILKPSSSEIIEQNDQAYVRANIIQLVTTLRKQNMLPAIVFSYNRSLVQKMMNILTRHLKENDEQIDRRTQKKIDKEDKLLKKIKEKEDKIKNDNDKLIKRRPGRELPNILQKGTNSLRNIGTVDSEDLKFIERRLSSVVKSSSIFVEALQHGIGMHHAGLNNKLRNTVEMLFRMKVLNIVFATGTLALGIHMPCKTTVIAGNSPYLNSLEYHQMSGRAGRRGYDTAGNVIFLGLSKNKQHTLLTAHLPFIQGMFPLHVTFMLRLLLLMSDVTSHSKSSETATLTTVSRILTLLENSLIYTQKPGIKEQVKHFFCFSVQFLMMQGYINGNGAPLKWCGLITHLHYHEPGNLAFVYLLRTGVIRKICTSNEDDNTKQYILVLILTHLFTKYPIKDTEDEYNNSTVYLDPLPTFVEKALREYNNEVNFVFNQYFINVAMSCSVRDNVLPLSKIEITSDETQDESKQDTIHGKFLNLCRPTIICSSFSALSGNDDDNNIISNKTVINSIKKGICSDVKMIPTIDLKFERNAYALDFYRHGVIAAIVNDNGLKQGEEFVLLQDFMLVIKVIRVSLEEMQLIEGENDAVYRHFKKLEITYNELFKKAFPNYNY